MKTATHTIAPAPPTALVPASTAVILDSISDGVFTVDAEWRITSFNHAAERITGIARQEALGRPCCEVFRANMCETNCALRHTLATGEAVVNRHGFIVNAAGNRIPISLSTALLKDGQGRVLGGVETFRDLSQVEELKRELAGRFQVGDLVSRSPLVRRLLNILPQVAASPSTVLIEGETGTGKELLARAMHTLSPRHSGPFIAVNCGALPEPLLESELFGYKAGAFTGADKDKPGRFALARRGTLFLDEIGEIPPPLQVKLLRVLQEHEFTPLGAVRTEKSDARIVAATNRDLVQWVRRGTFREDLYYRINVVRMILPPLRERREDIPLLVEHFIQRFNHLQGKTVSGVSRDVLGRLMTHDFPGNIRELENIIEHAFILCAGDRIEVTHLPESFQGVALAPPRPPGRLTDTLQTVQAEAIRSALVRHQGNRAAAARDLGIHRSTFFRLVRACRLPLPATDGRRRSHPPATE